MRSAWQFTILIIMIPKIYNLKLIKGTIACGSNSNSNSVVRSKLTGTFASCPQSVKTALT